MKIKNKVIFIYFILSSYSAFSQTTIYSLKFTGGYTHYFIPTTSLFNNEQRINYNINTQLSLRINERLSIYTGVSFYKKDFSENLKRNDSSSYVSKNVYKLSYINIPLLLNITLYNKPKFQICLPVGLSWAHLIDKKRNTTFIDGKSETGFNNIKFYYRDPYFLNVGIDIKYFVNKIVAIDLESNIRTQIRDDFTSDPHYYSINGGRYFFNFNCGIEYKILRKSK
jgi:hypothetical protein